MFIEASKKIRVTASKREVEILTSTEEQAVNWFMAEEFLRTRLGIKTTKENINRFVTHIVEFEREVARRQIKNAA